MNILEQIGQRAKNAAFDSSYMGIRQKNEVLLKIASELKLRAGEIVEANKLDLEAAKKDGMSESMLDRLTLNEARIGSAADGASKIATLEDPCSEVTSMKTMPNGLKIGVKRVPLGVLGIIYEARPNVTVDAAALCLKAGNAVILRGGKEAIHSNLKIVEIMRGAIESCGANPDLIQILEDTSRETAQALMRLNGYVDVLIPRGGAGLIRSVVENATIPVIETGVGNCHVYVDRSADLKMAVDITYNGKCSRPSVCNAVESLLVHEEVAREFLPAVKAALDRKNVELRGCAVTRAILGECVKPATEEDYGNEFLDYILSIKVVNSLDDAIRHINAYGSRHSECIVTSNYFAAQRFLDRVDAACVYVNASTRFTDGAEFGFGGEIGISTQKLHARGPMGLRELTTYKYIIYGEGQIR